MNALSFKLSGKTACFRKPDVNAYAYFTYNNIHKPALLGLLGAIIGLGGYTQLFEKNRGLKKGALGYDEGFPEFYEKLQHLKIAITPLAPNGYFSKKIQVFNNGVGYANAVGAKCEERASSYNLPVREQWLENPEWQIMILDDGTDEYKKIAQYLTNDKAVYIPYLGKNDHPAKIEEVIKIALSQSEGEYIDSLFIKNFEKLDGWARESDPNPYFFQEISPYTLQTEYHFYEFQPLVFTNYEIEQFPENTYNHDGKNYTFI